MDDWSHLPFHNHCQTHGLFSSSKIPWWSTQKRIIRNQKSTNQKKNSTTKTFESSISATMRFSFFLKNKLRFARRSFRFGVRHIPIRHRKKNRGKLSSLLSYFVPWNKSSKFIFPTTSKLLSSQNVWRLPCLAEWGFFFAIRFWNDPGYEMILLDFSHFLSHIGFSPKKKWLPGLLWVLIPNKAL